MAKLDDKAAFSLIQAYYNNETNRASVLRHFGKEFEGITDDILRLHKVKGLLPGEKDSEVVYALLGAFEDCINEHSASNLSERYSYRLRCELRNRGFRHPTSEIQEDSAPDPNPNPEEAYEQKEQIELIKKFLIDLFEPEEIDQFMKRYSEGMTLDQIGEQYGVSGRMISKRLKPMFTLVKRYMARMNAY